MDAAPLDATDPQLRSGRPHSGNQRSLRSMTTPVTAQAPARSSSSGIATPPTPSSSAVRTASGFRTWPSWGAPGLLLIVAVAIGAIGLGVAMLRRTRRSASAGVGAVFLAAFFVYLLHASVDWMWESTAVTVLALSGLAVIGARLNGHPGRPGSRLRLRLRAVLASGAVVAGLVQLPGLLSTTEISRSQAAERTGNGVLALAWAADTVSAEPWSASAYYSRSSGTPKC